MAILILYITYLCYIKRTWPSDEEDSGQNEEIQLQDYKRQAGEAYQVQEEEG